MGEVVNLRLARKAAARKAKEADAAANRAAHGRPRAERTATRAEETRLTRLLDGARREGTD
ncbi:DUF4169 family protein [Novosphingobium sp.]|uniref:DUF4169 family protein n=1 Tax=Novosphingobium sp. TaxID=1874826 RepID=UPI002612C1CA|nr:DUF4169 family protein [Novosphingobium sp.]